MGGIAGPATPPKVEQQAENGYVINISSRRKAETDQLTATAHCCDEVTIKAAVSLKKVVDLYSASS